MKDQITAGMVAAELRKLADALDREPDAECDSAFVYFSAGYLESAKERFLTMARLMPHPFRKHFTDTTIELKYQTPPMWVTLSAPRDKVCTIVEPAKPAVYDCIPLLSADEVAELEAAS